MTDVCLFIVYVLWPMIREVGLVPPAWIHLLLSDLAIILCLSKHYDIVLLCIDEKPQLRDVYKELFPLSTDWKSIGTLLGISKNVLDRIRDDNDGVNDRLQEMLAVWLKQIDPLPTWKQLADEVEVIDPTKARKIREKYAN